MKQNKRWYRLVLFGALLVLLACNLFTRSQELAVRSTLESLHLQQTALNQTLQVFTAEANSRASTPDGTLQANLATATAVAALEATLSNNPTIVATQQTGPDPRLLASARILLFENMSASRHIRIVKEALDELGYFYLDVGSAKGWFKSQLLSIADWDLVIAAAEVEEGEFGGEFFQYLDEQIAKGAGVVIENWNMDAAPDGKAGLLLRRCGLRFQADWFMPELRVFFWTQPQLPIFQEPNQIRTQLRNAAGIWNGDLGDLLELDPRTTPDPQGTLILASTSAENMNNYGLLASCLGNRVILQTFRTHEYHHDDMLALWQNYIYQSLKAHLIYTGQSIPTPVFTAQPAPSVTVTAAGPTPGPAYIFEHGCDGILSLKLTDAPVFQQDLFEHHADGEFVILRAQLENQANFPIQIWDQDYFLEASLDGQPVVYSPHKAATGYLYITGGINFSQDLIQPGASFRTALAFDINPRATDLVFVFKPGSKFNEQVCETRIPLNR